jgi:hypothetical protein
MESTDWALSRTIYVQEVSWRKIIKIAEERGISISALLIEPFRDDMPDDTTLRWDVTLGRIEGKLDTILAYREPCVDDSEIPKPQYVEQLPIPQHGSVIQGWMEESKAHKLLKEANHEPMDVEVPLEDSTAELDKRGYGKSVTVPRSSVQNDSYWFSESFLSRKKT